MPYENHPETIPPAHSPWKNYLPRNLSLVPQGLENAVMSDILPIKFGNQVLQSTSCEMPGWMNHKLESRLLAEISATSDLQMIPLQ